MGRTKNFAEVIRAKIASSRELAEAIKREAVYSEVAQKVYDLRTQAGLTQQELAEQIGVRHSVIARLEAADHEGHSLKLLVQIAEALGCNLRVEFDETPALQL